MPIGTCDPASRGETFNAFAIEVPAPDSSGYILAECHYTWDGTSAKPNCDGPVTYLQTRNAGAITAWALLPDKKRGSPWVQINPGTDVTITAKGQLSNLGLSNASDVQSVRLTFVNPGV